jgi:hypothetical protein
MHLRCCGNDEVANLFKISNFFKIVPKNILDTQYPRIHVMHLHLETPYTVPGQLDPVRQFEEKCILNNNLYEKIHNEAGSDVELTRSEIQNGRFIRDAIIHPRAEAVPAAIKVFVGTDALDFREHTTYDLKTHRGETETSLLAGPFKGKISAKISFSLRSAAPFQPRTVTHALDADIRANVWLIGGKLEKTMAKEIEAKQPQIQNMTQTALNTVHQELEEAA